MGTFTRWMPVGAFALLAVTPALAQTNSCGWVLGKWTCESRQPGNIFGGLQSPADVGQSGMDAFYRGVAQRQQADRERAERERTRAETELYRAQARAIDQEAGARAQAPTPSLAPTQAPPEHIQKWLEAARPRMGLFPDFAEVVFAPDRSFTPEMVMLMSGSKYAADIAYHIATHNAEGLAISKLSLLDAARAIDRIESEVKARKP